MVRAAKALLGVDEVDEGQLNTARAELYQVMDVEDDAYDTLRRLREIEASRWYLLSNLLKEQGKDWEAVFSYQEWTRKQFDRTILDSWSAVHPVKWTDLGNSSARMGLWSLAAYFYRRALAVDYSDALARLNYAEALIRSGQVQDAESYLADLGFSDPVAQAKVDWLLTQCLVAQSRYSEAAQHFKAVIDKDSNLVRTREGADIGRQIKTNATFQEPAALGAAWNTETSNMIVNGGFEQGVNGWGMWPEPGTNSTIVNDRVYTGLQSFRAQFDGTQDVNFYQVSQKVLVQPGHEYQLSAQMWAEDMSGDVALEVRAGNWFGGVTGPTAHGSTEGWQTVTHPFVAPPYVNEVTVTIVRYGGNGVVSGTVWVDDIVMLPSSVN